ncbi:MAG: hypothetical protein ABT01_07405 [Clostridium sp. SCN 57-10]|nr:MAG: hypothetical protein ABT01_07405 [Clostridium sp. SCN 57-10]
MLFKIVYWPLYLLLWPIYRFRFVGRENIPKGGIVVCANHTANIDSVLLGLSLGFHAHFAAMAKAELFQNKLVGTVLRALGAFPVHRGRADVSAIKQAFSLLRDGKQLLIFPEGTRVKTPDAAAEVKSGAGMIAMRSGAPVLPVYITPGKKAFRGCKVVIGTPFLPEKSGRPDQSDYARMSEQIMETIRKVGEQA